MAVQSSVALLYTLSADTTQAEAAIKKLSALIDAESKKFGNTRNLDSASSATKKATENLSSFEAYSKSASAAFGSFIGNLSANAVSSLTSALIEGGKAVLDYSSRLEQTKIGFETLTKSASDSQKLLKELQDLAQTTPFEFADLTDFAKRLLASNVELKNVTPLLKDIGNAVAAVGGSREDLEGTIRAITQIISKGKVSAEEINQLAERNINGFRILAEQTGKTEAQIRKLAEEGKVSSQVFVEAFQRFSREKFGDAMQRQSQTFQGALSNIKDSLLIAANQYFEPLFKKISQIGIDTAKEIQNADLADAFKILARNSAKGFGEALREEIRNELKNFKASDAQLPNQIGASLAAGMFNLKDGETVFTKIKQAYDQQGIGVFFGYLGAKYATSFNDGFQSKLTNEQFKAFANNFQKIYNTGADFNGKKVFLDTTTNTLKEIAETIQSVPSLADQIKADLAEIELEKSKKRAEALKQAIEDLNSKVTFFGDETEVAATKQKLLNAGITDFSTAGAKTALSMAQVLDNLKRAQDVQAEYNKKVEKAAEYMQTLRDNAQFEIKFPDATKLQQFDRYVKENAASFKELKYQIEATRAALETEDFIKNFKTFDDGVKSAFVGLDNYLTNLQSKASDLSDPLTDFALKLKLIDGIQRGVNDNPQRRAEDFARNVESLFDAYESTTNRLNELNSNFADKSEENKQIVLSATTAQENAYRQLYNYLGTLNADVGGKAFGLFDTNPSADKKATDFVERLRKIREAVANEKLTKGLKTLDELFESLNLRIGEIGAKTDLEKLNIALSDPAITEAIKQRADALGYTVEQLKELIRLKSENDADPRATGTRERVVETEDEGGFFGALKDGFKSLADNPDIQNASNTITAFGNLTKNAFDGIANAVGGAIEQWALYGGSIGKALKQALAAELAHVAGVATFNALYATALGFMRLAELDFVGAGNAFISAGLWAALAGGTALTARALAGNDKSENALQKQTSNSFSSGQGEKGRGGTAYSSYGDEVKTYESGASLPEQRIVIQIQTNDSHIVKTVNENLDKMRSRLQNVVLDLNNGY